MWLFTDLNGIGRIQEDKVALTGLVVGLGLSGTGLARNASAFPECR